MRVGALTAAIAVAAAVVMAGCGSGAGPNPSHRSQPQSHHRRQRQPPATVTHTVTHATTTTHVATAVTTSSTSSGRSAARPAVATGPACVAADLAVSYLGGADATGHGELGFALRNTGPASCHTYGYPGVLLLGRSGAPLPTTPSHTTTDFFGTTTERVLTVPVGKTVSFRLGVSHVSADGGSHGCITADGLRVIAPDDTATLTVAIPNGAMECGGAVTVSPLQPGTSAYAAGR